MGGALSHVNLEPHLGMLHSLLMVLIAPNAGWLCHSLLLGVLWAPGCLPVVLLLP